MTDNADPPQPHLARVLAQIERTTTSYGKIGTGRQAQYEARRWEQIASQSSDQVQSPASEEKG